MIMLTNFFEILGISLQNELDQIRYLKICSYSTPPICR